MYSTFIISKSECMTCTNVTLKSLGTLQGVFGAEVDQINGKIEVSHTDEVTRTEILEKLISMGISLVEEDAEVEKDEPSIWGCAL